MKKYLTILILFFSFTASAQIIYTPMSAGGYQMKYLKTDSGFALPFRDTTIGRGVDRPGLMVINYADSLPYYYNGRFWKPVYVDSTGVIELINGKVDSVTVNGNNIFYWVAGLGYGAQLNKLDSIHVSADSIFTCIAGNCTFQYLTTAGTGTVTSIMAGFGLTGDTITTTGTIAVDTSVFHTSNWNNAAYAPIVHFHSASDIISGTLPIARGGTGLSGIGGAGQSLRVASSGSALEYYTPPDVSGKVNYTDSGSIYVTPTQLSLSHTDSTAYHTASLNSDSTQLSLTRANGTKDTIEVWADGYVPSSGSASRFGIEDNTGVQDRVVNMGTKLLSIISTDGTYSTKIMQDYSRTAMYMGDFVNYHGYEAENGIETGISGLRPYMYSQDSSGNSVKLEVEPTTVKIHRGSVALNVATSVNNSFADTTGNVQLSQLKVTTKSTDPTTTDIPDGYSAIYKNTTSGLVYLWANIGGTLYKTQLN